MPNSTGGLLIVWGCQCSIASMGTKILQNYYNQLLTMYNIRYIVCLKKPMYFYLGVIEGKKRHRAKCEHFEIIRSVKWENEGAGFFQDCLFGDRVLNKWKWELKFSKIWNQGPTTFRCLRVYSFFN